MDLPRARIVGYQASRPHLRILTLPEELVEPAPAPGAVNNSDVALDSAIVREGWFALFPSRGVWGMSLPFSGEGFRVEGEWDRCCPAPNPRNVWLARSSKFEDVRSPRSHDQTLVAEYDGVARVEVRRFELPPELSLRATITDGLLTSPWESNRAGLAGLQLFRYGASDPEPFASELGPDLAVVGQAGDLLMLTETRSLGRDGFWLYEPGACQPVYVAPPPGMEFGMFSSFSPDADRIAIGIENPEAVHGRAGRYVRDQSSMMAIVDARTGAVRVADGGFDNFASSPVWTADGRWVIFDAPFDLSLYACDTLADQPTLIPVLRKRGRPSPLVVLE